MTLNRKYPYGYITIYVFALNKKLKIIALFQRHIFIYRRIVYMDYAGFFFYFYVTLQT